MTKKVTYVGLDVHDATIVAAWRKAGEAEHQKVVVNNEEGIELLVSAVGLGQVWAVYETSGVGFVLHDQLKTLGWKVSVLATTRLPRTPRAEKRKTDVADARHLLDVLVAHGECGNELPAVWVPPVKTREDRELVRHRLDLGEVIARIRTKIKCLLKVHGLKYPSKEKTAWSRKYMAWLRGLTGGDSGVARSVRLTLASHLRLLEQTKAETHEFDKELERLSEEPAYAVQVQAVRKTKGVGLLTGLVYLLELGDVTRFRNRRQVGSYIGLTPNCWESGEATNRKGHISRMGPGRVRKVLNQAAWVYLRMHPQELAWYRRVAYRRGAKRALVGVMRRLAIEIWHSACDALKSAGTPAGGAVA